MSLDVDQPADGLRAIVEAAHGRALDAFTDDSTSTMQAVVWLSAHLAATSHVIYPVVISTMPDGREWVAQQRPVTQQLQSLLRMLEQHHSGDAQSNPRIVAERRQELMEVLSQHSEAEDEMLARLDSELGHNAAAALAAKYQHALEHGPTRPHPHMPELGFVGRVAYVIDRLKDHAMDALDSRQIPIPRSPRHVITAGRWGLFLLGASEPASVAEATEGTAE